MTTNTGKKCLAVIESCETVPQLATAWRFTQRAMRHWSFNPFYREPCLDSLSRKSLEFLEEQRRGGTVCTGR